MIGVAKIGIAASRVGGGAAPVSPDFIFTIDTTKAGISASNSIELPLLGGGTYTNLTIDWGDGSSQTLDNANKTHTYATGGVYECTVSGDRMNRFYFNNGGDKLKMIEVKNWGLFETDVNNSFTGCSNMTLSATDSPTFASTGPSGFFNLCSSVNSPINFDLGSSTSLDFFAAGMTSFNSSITLTNGNVTSGRGFLDGATSFDDPSINDIDVSTWTNFNVALRNVNLTSSLAKWDITSMTTAASFMSGGGMSQAAYDATLIGWETTLQAAYPNGSGYTASINIHFGGSQYSSGLMNIGGARYNLINVFGWTITDGGAA